MPVELIARNSPGSPRWRGERRSRPSPCPWVAPAHDPGQGRSRRSRRGSATGLAVALAAGPAGAATKPVWIMTAGNVQSLSAADASTASYFFNTPVAYGAGASLVKTPVQARYSTTPVLSYTSYARFSSDIRNGAIRYPYKWVMYDPENWSATPVGERQAPVKYMALFGQQHRRGGRGRWCGSAGEFRPHL